MKNDNEPTINGAFVVLAVVAIALLVYLIIQSAVGRLDELDEKRGNYSIAVTGARRAEQRAAEEQEKRAQLLEFIKAKGFYADVPENLKTFPQSKVDSQIINSNSEKH